MRPPSCFSRKNLPKIYKTGIMLSGFMCYTAYKYEQMFGFLPKKVALTT